MPFGLFRLLPGDGSQPPAPSAASEAETPPPAPAPSPLAELARQMGAEALPEKIAGAEFFEGEGSRCRSNDQDSALAFLRQVRDAGLGEAETKALASSRLDLLGACGWEQEELGGVLAQGVESAAGKAFATYLEAAANFYSGRFDEAEQGFKALQDVSQPWLKETALYLQARTLLNAAQQNAFDDMGFPELQNVDKARLEQTRSALGPTCRRIRRGSTPPRPRACNGACIGWPATRSCWPRTMPRNSPKPSKGSATWPWKTWSRRSTTSS